MVTKREEGYSRPQSELLKLYRATFLNIDNEIVNHKSVRDCFYMLW